MYTTAKCGKLQLSVLTADDTIGRCLRTYGEFAKPESDLLINIAKTQKPGGLLDIGANVGAISLPFAKAMPGWKVLCFEPQLAVHGALAANIVNNGLDNVTAFPWVVGERSGIISFPQPTVGEAKNFGAVGADKKAKRYMPVLGVKLDDLELKHVRLIKVDVEGFELEVLKGARKLIEAQSPFLLLEAKLGAKTQAVMKWLNERGYALYWFYAPFLTPKSGASQKVSLIGDANIVAVKGKPWSGLPRIKSLGEDWRSRLGEFTYLKHYGFKL